MHVSYRRPVELFVRTTAVQRAINDCDAGRTLVDVPLILRRCRRPNAALPAYLRYGFDLQIMTSARSGIQKWEPIGSRFGLPRDPQGTSRRAPGEPQETPRSLQEPPGLPQALLGSQQSQQKSQQKNQQSTKTYIPIRPVFD